MNKTESPIADNENSSPASPSLRGRGPGGEARVRKPEWLKINIGANERYTETKRIVESHCLHTICSSGRCPNMGECWGKGTATFMIGGDICTRSCKFCNTQTGRPLALDANEPTHVAESIQLMKLSHAVVTSVDRDDLPDLGAAHWAKTIREIKRLNPETTIEVLIPDFQGRTELIDRVIEAKPEIISHNMETVKRISPLVRSAANYATSLEVIRRIADSGTVAKSGIMVGLGETPSEVEELMDDLVAAGCRILTIGQYLQPTHKHYPVKEYVTPAQFAAYKEIGLKKGFEQVESAPLVRSSYHAEKHVRK
ncbi:lipoyl synthase [Bacteroides sp.]